MSRLWLPLSAVVLAIVFPGCDEMFYVALSEAESTPDRPVFVLGKDDSLFRGTARVYGWDITGRPRDWQPGPDSANPWHGFWDVHAAPDRRYVELDRIVYGVLPSGMCHVAGRDATSGPDSLRVGYVYILHIGYHGVGSDAYFEIRQDNSGTRSIHALTEETFFGIVRP